MNARRRLSMVVSLLVLAGLAVLAMPTLGAQAPAAIQTAVDAAYAKFRTVKEGKNADYIPALAKVDPNLFGIAVVTVDGQVYTAGDVKTEVSIQSISKVFTMAQVIEEQGAESVEKQIGVDATGARFNSIIAVEAVRTVAGAGATRERSRRRAWCGVRRPTRCGRRSSASTTPPLGASSKFCRMSTNRSRTRTSATRRSAH